jgi:hypothetical protein
MANSTTNLKTITSSQYQKEVTANGLFDACSPATIFGRKDTSAGLNWDYYGGTLLVDGIPTQISNGSVTLTASATNYVQATRDIIVPLAPFQWTVYNGTNQSLRFIGATGTGITVATTKRAIVYSDGTNVVRVTADT